MLRYFRVKPQPTKIVPDSGDISADDLSRDPTIPITLRQINNLPENAKRRVYRGFLPPSLLARQGVDPIAWQASSSPLVRLLAEPGTGSVSLGVRSSGNGHEEFIQIDLADNALNGIDLNFLELSDPHSDRFYTDYDAEGNSLLFGTTRRNQEEELRAKQAGLAPGQTRLGLGGSRQVLDQIEAFLALLGHRAYFLEPLTYASAWVFERRGFAYVRGHKLMEDIHREFQPGGLLYQALDGSTPFRQPDQWSTVRGRAWAIHDGILESINAVWDGLRMIKQVGRHARVITFPDAAY